MPIVANIHKRKFQNKPRLIQGINRFCFYNITYLVPIYITFDNAGHAVCSIPRDRFRAAHADLAFKTLFFLSCPPCQPHCCYRVESRAREFSLSFVSA